MDKPLFDCIVRQLLPHMDEPASRKALVTTALYGSPVLDRIAWDGAPYPFTVHLIQLLHEFGEIEPGRPALVALLEEVATHVGTDKHKEIGRLILDYSAHTQKGQTTMALDSAVLIGFLLEIGRWAKSELSELWKFRRQQQEIDLTNRAQVERAVPELLQDIINEKSEREVKRIVALIERKRDAIDRARNAKLADREEYDQQRLTRAAFEQREKESNQTIRQMLDEIADDLDDLGAVERIKT